MKADKIMNAIGDVEDRYITEAMEYRVKKKPIWLWKAAVAACLCIAIIGGAFTVRAYARDLKYYKEIVDTRGIVMINPTENPPQVDRYCYYMGFNGDTPRLMYMATLTTDRTRYTVDDYIYVTIRIENLAPYSLEFLLSDDRHGIVHSFFNKTDDYTVELYDSTYSPYDITSENHSKPRIALDPGEFYTQTIRFSAKYVSKQPGYRPVEADQILPAGFYEGTFMISSNAGTCMLEVPIEIVDTPST